jgi:tRNA splicing ligase
VPRQWSALERHTTAPYTLTLKSNGCIIFLAARSPEHVLVTSKHSLTSAHAAAGRAWLAKALASVGRTEAQLAQTLWDNNWTAVAEVRVCTAESAVGAECARRSCATTGSRSTCSRTRPRRRACTCMA